MSKTVAVDRTYQEWMARGMLHIALELPPHEQEQAEAIAKLLACAELVTLVMPDQPPEGV